MKALHAKNAVEAFKKIIKQKKQERVWTDKGSEFKGEFKKFCEKKEIHLCTNENKTKSAFAERNIRSLKNIIHKYLEENWTWTYIKQLPQFVNTTNSRVNRVTQLAPNKTFKKHEPFLISLAISTKSTSQNTKKETWFGLQSQKKYLGKVVNKITQTKSSQYSRLPPLVHQHTTL